jgi:peptide/nickel transport system substrate-binding protein
MNKKLMFVLGLVVVASMVLSACQPQTVVQTVVVTEMVAGTPQTVIVTATPAPTTDTGPAIPVGPLPAEAMVACNPLPTAALSGSGVVASPAQPQQDITEGSPVLVPAGQTTGKVYKVGVFEDITTLNFWGANGPDNTVWNSYMLPPRLAMYGLSDVYFYLEPSLALAMPDPLTQEGDFWVTSVPIRQDVKWSDGTPFTAEDVAWTANFVLQMGLISGNWSSWYDGNFLSKVEAADTYTVKYFYHTKPGLARHEYGTLQAPILSKAYWEPKVQDALAPILALGASPAADALAAAQASAADILFAIAPEGEPLAGQFIFSKWETGAFLENATNAGYFLANTTNKQWLGGGYSDSTGYTNGDTTGDPALTINVGPFVDAVSYSIYADQNSAILALQNGDVDFVLNSLGLQRGLTQTIESDPNLTVISNPTNGFRYMAFNERRRPMNDCSFRQAVAILIDKEFVTQTILQNVAYPVYTFIPEGNGAWYFADTPKIGQGLSREQRINMAVQILEGAGYTWTDDQKPTWDADNRQVVAGGRLIMPDGTPVPDLNLWAPSPGYDPLRSTFAIWIESWLKEAGIPVTAELAGFNVLVPKIFTEQDFDMYILGWSLSVFPSFLRDFFSEEQAAQDGNNAGGYISPEFESLSSGLLTCENIPDCKDLANQVQVLLGTEVPYVLLFDTGIIEAYRSASVSYPYTTQLSGLQYTHQGGGTLQSEVNVK